MQSRKTIKAAVVVVVVGSADSHNKLRPASLYTAHVARASSRPSQYGAGGRGGGGGADNKLQDGIY